VSSIAKGEGEIGVRIGSGVTVQRKVRVAYILNGGMKFKKSMWAGVIVKGN